MFKLDSLTKEYLESLRARELYQIAREIKVLRYTRFKKQELINAILDMRNEYLDTDEDKNAKIDKAETKKQIEKSVKEKEEKPTKITGYELKKHQIQNYIAKKNEVEKSTLSKVEKPNKKAKIDKVEVKKQVEKPVKEEVEKTVQVEVKKHIERPVEKTVQVEVKKPVEPKPYKNLNTQKPDQNNDGNYHYDKRNYNKDQSRVHHNRFQKGKGVLDVHSDGYGFLRSTKYVPDVNDIYVHPSLIRKLGLRPGDYIEGNIRGPRNEKEKYSALIAVETINDAHPTTVIKRPRFEDLIPIFPLERFNLAGSLETSNISNRLIELISPIGKGQRGLIVSPPKAGKTTIIKRIAQGIAKNNPEVYLMVLLVDERPEEVTDMQRSVNADIISSTFDQLPENHIRVAELALQRAKRLVEMQRDVVILLDGITRLTRAYNLSCTPSGRTLTGGLDTAAIHGPKKFIGAARNIDGGGSLTILATSLVETGSKMDEIIYEEFKGTGNMELVLDRKMAEKRIFPSFDLSRSSTRREELLYDGNELRRIWMVRKFLSGLDNSEALERLIKWLKESSSNEKFLESIAIQTKTTKV
ncbi:MAG: transcription termination factor Rho [Caldisericia bacterium]|nr:transcription termination factor Rho [Caldisericia bacterium]